MTNNAYESFQNVEICSGTIIKAEEFPKARKPAYKVWVDFGEAKGTLQTSAQITVHYTPESLVGMQVCGLVNIGARNIAGFESQFLLLGFADPEGAVVLVTPSKEVPNGKMLH